MGIIQRVKGWFNTLLNKQVTEVFGVKVIDTSVMTSFVNRCIKAYQGYPDWIKAGGDVKTINFAKSLCSETARLTTMGIDISITGSARADWLQKQIDKEKLQIRNNIEFGLAQGTMILKPNGNGIEFIPFERFRITKADDNEINGAVFIFTVRGEKEKWYTRFEHHHFLDNGNYAIENKAFSGNNEGAAVNEERLENTPWSNLRDYVEIEGVEHPLFAVFVTPSANNIAPTSHLGLPIFSDALQELEDLDIAYSRNAGEIFDSEKIILLDSDRLVPSGGKVSQTGDNFENQRDQMKLPHYVKNVYGTGTGDFYQEINPQLNTATRLQGINALLSQIGYKVGYSNGYFVFNEKSGLVTATQIDADQQKTIQLIKENRDKLQACLERLIYALDKFADLYELAPVGEYEAAFDFADITYNVEEDRARWYSYVVAGKVPFWYFLQKFEGFTKEDAKALEAAAQPQETLFGAAE